MALVTRINHKPLQANSPHRAVDCTYSIVVDEGATFLQLDTYGSNSREFKDKKSQSLRLSASAIVDLKALMVQHGL